MNEGAKAVFLSYASQDAEAVKKIADALRAAGVEVWFDQNELVGGDAWDAKIRKQIAECALFVPVISANSQARLEGYFRLEWKLAAQRTHTMADEVTFLLPVVLDGTRDAEAKVPVEFRAVQWTRLRPGLAGPAPEEAGLAAFCGRVRKLLAGEAPAPAPAVAAAPAREPAPAQRRFRWWWIAPVFGMTMALALVMRDGRKASATPPPATPAPAGQTEAQKLVQQAQAIYGKCDQLDRQTLFLADDLVKRALALDPAEPSAWLLAARLSYLMVWQGFDGSEAREAELQRQAARARALAPDSVPAQLAVINAQVAAAFGNFDSASNRQDLAPVERELLALAARAPQDYEVQQALGQTYRFLKRPDEALQAMRRSLELSGGDSGIVADVMNVLLRRKRYAEAEAMIPPAMARQPVGRILVLDVQLKTVWRGALPAAQAALARWPGWLLREDRGAFVAWQTWMFSRQPDMALEVASRLPRDYLHDVWFTGPRAVLTARAHELAGHEEAAQADWRTVLRIADRELAGSPDDVPALFWKVWAQSRLGDRAGAEATRTLLMQRNQNTATFFRSTSLALLWTTLGRTDLAAEHLRASFSAVDDAYAVTRKMLELDPAYAPLRADPQFASLAAAALAPAEVAAPGSAPAAAVVEDKSVAVLAFANLSDDKSNEYFSDGISEELLNVLAKVPGLKVSARTSAFYFKGKEVPVPEIARQLGVAYVVEGSVRKAGDKVRITAQLIKAADGFHVWSDTFTRDLKDTFAVQDEIAGLIAKNLSLKMGVAQAGAEVSPEAYTLYLQARAAWALRTEESLARARAMAQRALDKEPRFARALALLAAIVAVQDRENFPLALDLVGQALAIDPNLAEAHGVQGMALSNVNRFEEAGRALRRSVELDPNYASGYQWLGRCLTAQGDMTAGLAAMARAAELDPLAPRILDNYAAVLSWAGRHREALDVIDRVLALQPDSVQGQQFRVRIQFELGKPEEAIAQLAKPGVPFRDVATVARALLATGQRARAEALLTTTLSDFDRGLVLCALGRGAEALPLLKPRVSVHREMILWEDQAIMPRSEPGFAAALEQWGLTEAWRRAEAWRASRARDKAIKQP